MKKIGVASLLLLSGLVFVSCSQSKPAGAPPPAKVTVSLPVSATVTNCDEYPGRLEAVEMVEIRPRVAGHIMSIHFQDGVEVKAGDLLFVIDPKPYEADLDKAKAMTKQAQTQLELAQNDLTRVEKLRGTRAISEEDYDSRSKAVRMASDSVNAAQAGESNAVINLDYTQVKAPISGRIGRRMVTPGNFVQLQGNGGAAPVLATIVSMDPIYCYFDADEHSFLAYRKNGNLGTGDPKANSLACELALGDDKGFVHIGSVDFYDNQVNPNTGTIRIRGVFPNADRSLVPGLFGTVRVPSGPPVTALMIPDVAIMSDQGHKFVVVVNGEKKVEVRPIVAGRAYGPLRAVLQGLTAQDQVIVNGLTQAMQAMQTQATVDTTPPAGNAAGPATTEKSGAKETPKS